jgi:radical SAM protein with 4Fe4S-binding SPASM domain
MTFLSFRADIHDAITDVPGSHARAVVALHNLLRRAERGDMNLGVHIVLTSTNAPSLRDTVLFLISQGVRTISVNRSMPTATESFRSPAQCLSMESYVKAFLDALELASRSDTVLVNVHKVPLCRLPNGAPQALFSHACGIGRSLLVVEPDGGVLDCDFLSNRIGQIGNGAEVETKSICEALCKHRATTRQLIDEFCGECELLEFCGGRCPAQTVDSNPSCN